MQCSVVIEFLRREASPSIWVWSCYKKKMRDTLCLSLNMYAVCGWIRLDNRIKNLLIIPW